MFDTFNKLPAKHKRAALNVALAGLLAINNAKQIEETTKQDRRARAAARSRQKRSMYNPKSL